MRTRSNESGRTRVLTAGTAEAMLSLRLSPPAQLNFKASLRWLVDPDLTARQSTALIDGSLRTAFPADCYMHALLIVWSDIEVK